MKAAGLQPRAWRATSSASAAVRGSVQTRTWSGRPLPPGGRGMAAWSPRQVAAYFSRVLPSYAPYLWAVGVGNEQDLTMGSNYGQGRSPLGGHGRTTGQAYRAVWNAVDFPEPVSPTKTSK